MVFTPRPTNATPTVPISLKRRLFSILLMVSLLGAVGIYIAMTNGVSTQGYKIEELNKNLTALSQTRQRLEAEAAQRQAVKTLDNGEIPEGYVVVERVEYLAPTPQVGVAVK